MSEGDRATEFFGRTFEEALALAVEARNYIAIEQAADRRTLALVDGLRLSHESVRLVARVTRIMAWLLARKAVFAGEMTGAQATAADVVLSDQAICFDEAGEACAGLPPRFRALLRRSRRLYVRVARLDDMVRRQFG